jgi:hypothetical protein
MGMSIEELGDDLEEVAAGKFVTKSVPKPHSAFESYVLVATARHGLSWVKAIGHMIDCSPYGFENFGVRFDAGKAGSDLREVAQNGLPV